MNSFAKIDRDAFLRYAAAHPELRLELEKGRIVQQMTGGTLRHALIARRISQIIEQQLDAAGWRVVTDRGVGVGESSRYPDVVVEPADESLESLATERPELIVEVLSPSTTSTDLNVKPLEYCAIVTLSAYVVASQDEPAILVWQRDAAGRFPELGFEISGLDEIASIRCRDHVLNLSLAEIYRGLT
jgi:Uma2 family endonuclease